MNTTQRIPAVELTTCPSCGAVAEILFRAVLESTDGPIEHAKVRCAASHHFLLPTAHLVQDVQAGSRAVSPVRPRR